MLISIILSTGNETNWDLTVAAADQSLRARLGERDSFDLRFDGEETHLAS